MDATIIAAIIGAIATIIAAAISSAASRQTPAHSGQRRTSGNIVTPDPVHGRNASQQRVGLVPLVLLFGGIFAFFSGFALFGYVVVRFIVEIFSALSAGPGAEPDLSSIPFVPLLPLGAGLAFVGIVLYTLGSLIGGVSLLRGSGR